MRGQELAHAQTNKDRLRMRSNSAFGSEREFDFLGGSAHAQTSVYARAGQADKYIQRVLVDYSSWLLRVDAQTSNWNWFSEDQAQYRRGTPKNEETLPALFDIM